MRVHRHESDLVKLLTESAAAVKSEETVDDLWDLLENYLHLARLDVRYPLNELGEVDKLIDRICKMEQDPAYLIMIKAKIFSI